MMVVTFTFYAAILAGGVSAIILLGLNHILGMLS